ncbi:MAG: nucleotidyltransferase family protein [Anaerolineales bacterium]|nr:nucleotidyltransferase family protein [Anaerolineales bacterium]
MASKEIKDITSICIRPETSIHIALETLDKGALGIVLVTDADLHLIGTITDGDIRRAVLAGLSLETSVSHLLESKAGGMYASPIAVHVDTPQEERIKLLQQYLIYQLPVLDEEDRVVDLITIDTLVPEEALPVNALIMAGGYGTRLSPLTDDTPKPLLPVGGKPLMEWVVEQLNQSGIRNIHISTHYLGERIKNHFGNGESFGVNIDYLTEDSPLGTAGALGLVGQPDGPLLVINGDILTQLNFREMFAFHQKHHADLTVGVRQFSVQVPYGVVESDDVQVTKVREKPTYSFLVNAGVYLLEPSAFAFFPAHERFDMPDLITTLIEHERSVVSFPILEYWLDIGQHTDYRQAQEDIQKGKFSL